MRPLTNETPKPMLLLNEKPILEHIIESLPENIDELILVVGYLHHKIHAYFKHQFGRFKIDYLIQGEKKGTYDALKLCSGLLEEKEKFLLMFADDLHGREGLEKCANSKNLCVLVSEAKDPRRFGVIEADSKGIVRGFEEKPENPKSSLVSTGVLLLDKSVFNYPAKQHPNGEHYLTDSISQMIQDGYKFEAIRSTFWLPIGYPSDLERAEQILNRK